jgi:hypothetical protein
VGDVDEKKKELGGFISKASTTNPRYGSEKHQLRGKRIRCAALGVSQRQSQRQRSEVGGGGRTMREREREGNKV